MAIIHTAQAVGSCHRSSTTRSPIISGYRCSAVATVGVGGSMAGGVVTVGVGVAVHSLVCWLAGGCQEHGHRSGLLVVLKE